MFVKNIPKISTSHKRKLQKPLFLSGRVQRCLTGLHIVLPPSSYESFLRPFVIPRPFHSENIWQLQFVILLRLLPSIILISNIPLHLRKAQLFMASWWLRINVARTKGERSWQALYQPFYVHNMCNCAWLGGWVHPCHTSHIPCIHLLCHITCTWHGHLWDMCNTLLIVTNMFLDFWQNLNSWRKHPLLAGLVSQDRVP